MAQKILRLQHVSTKVAAKAVGVHMSFFRGVPRLPEMNLHWYPVESSLLVGSNPKAAWSH